MLRRISFSLLFFVTGLLLISVYFFWKNSLPLVSPIALIEVLTGNAPAIRSPKIIYGFFPYWNNKYANDLNINFLTHFAYFAIDLNPDGSINKINSSKEQEPGWNKLNGNTVSKLLYQSKLLGQKTVLTITAMDPELIESLLNSANTSSNAIGSIIGLYRDFKFDDINIDFEYVGEPSSATRVNFVGFIRDLKRACLVINPKCQIDIDIFADTGSKYRLWDLASLNQIVDHFIVMAYDYYRKTSTQAGPVAPLIGKCTSGSTAPCLDQDIVSHLSEITKIIPSEKIILGIPFYGYEWQTAGENFLTNTYPRSGSMASYTRIQSLFTDPTISSLSAKWSPTTLSPYLVFNKDNDIHQIHFENSESLRQKMKLIKSANLGGVAIWALGYEVPYQDLWGPIKDLSNP